MKRSVLIILFTLLCLNATEDNWIDPRKKAILLDYAQDISEAKTIAKKYKDHDVYIYNTIQNSNACCAIHIVNIKKSNMKSLLKKIQKDNSSAKELSRTRIRYFSKDMSPKNFFIESGEKIIYKESENITIASKVMKVQKKQIIKSNLAQDTQEEWIDPTKKAILVKYVRNPKEANDVAQEYQNQDIYIHSTVKNTETCCAVYIVNIKKQNVQSILKAISLTTNNAKKISNAKLKYFASDISPINKFISANNKENIEITKVIKPQKEIIPETKIIEVVKVIEPKKEIIPETKIIEVVKVIEPKKEIIQLKYINIQKKAITIVTTRSLKKAKKTAKILKKYDIYIYKTKTTKIPYFVLYAVNIEKNKYAKFLQDIRKKFKDAYKSSQNRIKSLSTNNFNSNFLFLSRNIELQTKINLNPQTVKYDYNTPVIKFKPLSIKKIITKQIDKKRIKKEYNSIDINKKAITIVTAINLKKAKKMAEQLNKYDIYIYQTTTTRVPYFIVYAVNIPMNNRKIALENIKIKFRDAYNSSNTRIKSLASNNFLKNIFIPSL